MECSVCYDSHAGCKLVCGHTFCHSCVRQWYESSSEPTCPMCRGNLYFRGMRKCVEHWDQEAEDKQRAEAWDEVLTELFDFGCDIDDLVWAEERFKYCDDVDIVLDDDIEFEITTVNMNKFKVHDPFTWRSLLFVTKHRPSRDPSCRLKRAPGLCAL